MKGLLCIFILLSLCACSTTKKIGTSKNKQVEMQLYIDELNQLYTLKQNNTLTKYDKEAKLLFEVSDNTLGRINVLDVSNPLQILAFHKNFQIVKIFDRTMTLNARIDLNRLNLFEIRTVASANDNRIWVFDELNQELLKIDKNGNVQGRNNDLRLRLTSNATPYRIIEYQNTVYMFDEVHGILICNAFGEYVRNRDFDYGKTFSYWQGKVFIQNENTLVVYDLPTGEVRSQEIKTSAAKGRDFHLIDGQLIYIDAEETIQIKSNL